MNLLEFTDAEKSYFEQTRKECDTEKIEKDKLLNYAFLVSGSAGILGLYKVNFDTLENSVLVSLISTTIIFTISVLFKWRRQKIQAQAYRWKVLKELIDSKKNPNTNWRTLEDIIVAGIDKNKHGIQDKLFFLALCLPFVCFLSIHTYNILIKSGKMYIIILPIIALSLIIESYFALTKKLRTDF